MKREEAVYRLNALLTMCDFRDAFGDRVDSKLYEDAVAIAIEALKEREKDGNLIIKQDAIDAICTWDKFGVDERGRIVRWHEGLEPYVHLRDVVTAIVNLPSAEQKQKTGKWFTNIKKGTITCQVCKEEISYYPSIGIRPLWEYCPYCGSYNGGEQDD